MNGSFVHECCRNELAVITPASCRDQTKNRYITTGKTTSFHEEEDHDDSIVDLRFNYRIRDITILSVSARRVAPSVSRISGEFHEFRETKLHRGWLRSRRSSL